MTDRPAGPRPAGAVRAPRPDIRGPGSRAQAAGIADTVTRGLELGAATLAGGTTHIPQLRLRLPAGAGEAEIARALQRALAATRRGGPQ